MDYRFLNMATDDSFRAAALADYMESCAQAYQDLIAAVTEASLLTPPDDSASDGLYDPTDEIDQVMANYGFVGSESITLSNGYVTIRDLLTGVATQMERYADPLRNDPTALIDDVIPLLKGDGTSWILNAGTALEHIKSTNVAAIMDDLKASLHSNVVSTAALRASLSASVADRITVFNDSIKQVFADSFTDFSATASYMRSLLSDGSLSATDIGKAIISAMGTSARASDAESVEADSPLSEYTGASPAATLDFSTAKKAVEAVGTVVAGAVTGIVTGIWTMARPLFNKAIKAVKGLVDPYDLEIKNESPDAAPSVDGWMIQGKPTGRVVVDGIEDYEDQWIKYETIFGEVLTRFTDVQQIDGHSKAIAEFQAKPYVLDPIRLSEIDASTGGNFGVAISTGSDAQGNFTKLHYQTQYASIDAALPFISACKDDISSLYADLDTISELNAYFGLLLGRRLLWSTFFITCFPHFFDAPVEEQIAFAIAGGDFRPFDYKIYEDSQHPGRYPVTNKDWISAASCWDGETTNPDFPFNGQMGTIIYNPGTASVTFLQDQAADRAANPLSWVFIPYRNNMSTFKPSKYGVKTDSANQKALTTFCTVAVSAIIVIALAVTIGVVAKKIARAKFWKRQKFVGKFDNATWNGTLESDGYTKRDYRKYIRYSRKLNASSLLTSGIQETGSSTMSGILSNLFAGDSAQGEGINSSDSMASLRSLLV